MKEKYKQFGEGQYYHIYNRGNNKANIFIDEDDFSFFILRLKQNLFPDDKIKRIQPLPEGSFSLIAYALMSNHFHLLLRQNKDIPTSKLLARLCTSYSKYFNKKYERVGHVFQGRFKQVNIKDDGQLLWLTAYIHQNPCLSNIATKAKDYRWSSCNEYIKSPDGLCEKGVILNQFDDKIKYLEFMENALPILKINKEARQ